MTDRPFTDEENQFILRPSPTHQDVLRLSQAADELGYRLLFARRPLSFTLEQVQSILADRGSSAFMQMMVAAEDISPKAPPRDAEEFLKARLAKLKPEYELLIVDPYLFTKSRRHDAAEYAEAVARLITPLLTSSVVVRMIVSAQASHPDVEEAVRSRLTAVCSGSRLVVAYSEDFHDRFWIADRNRGLVVGTSLNGIGSKIFLVDELRSSDVVSVLDTVASLLGD